MKKETLDFEGALQKLEAIVQKLEDPDVPLQEGFALYEEGMKLTAQMKKELNEIEKKVKILQKDAKGDMQEADFEPRKMNDYLQGLTAAVNREILSGHRPAPRHAGSRHALRPDGERQAPAAAAVSDPAGRLPPGGCDAMSAWPRPWRSSIPIR